MFIYILSHIVCLNICMCSIIIWPLFEADTFHVTYTHSADRYSPLESTGIEGVLGGSSHVHRLGGFVHPSYVYGRLAPTKILWKSPGLWAPPKRSVGSSPPSIFQILPGNWPCDHEALPFCIHGAVQHLFWHAEMETRIQKEAIRGIPMHHGPAGDLHWFISIWDFW